MRDYVSHTPLKVMLEHRTALEAGGRLDDGVEKEAYSF